MLDGFRVLEPRLDLGVRALRSEWASLGAREGLRVDVLDGLALASTLLPLSIWIAVISGAPPEAGIVAAAIGTIACVFFGGTHTALSGPGLATSVVIAQVASNHGMGAVGAVVVVVGLLQLVTGVLGLGRFARLLPTSVLRGFVFGVGAFMLFLHLPAVVGADTMANVPLLERIDRIGVELPHANVFALAVAVSSVLLALALPLAGKRMPGALLGLAIPALVAAILELDLPRLTMAELPAINPPALPSRGVAQLVGAVIALWITTTLTTLSATEALEKLADRDMDPNQELIGNGLAGIACGLVGALPTTQLLPRSTVALRLGVTTRRPALVHAVVLLIAGAAAWPILHHVPMAALTGVVVATAIPLLDPRPLRDLLRISRPELAIAAVTALGIVGLGMTQGLEAGIALAIVYAAFRVARTRALLHVSTDADAPHQVSFSGPITFLAALELQRLDRELLKADPVHGVVIDLRSVVGIDGTGAEGVLRVVADWRARGGRIALLGPSPRVRERLLAADRTGEVHAHIATSSRDVEPILEKSAGMLGRPNILAGVERFRDQMRDHYDSLFDQLADGQHPHTMFITCADSRISPGQMMGAHPGDLFIVRCLGALVPGAGSEHMPQEGAALEYGVGVLGVRHVVVCGHSKCGAINALKKGAVPAELATLGTWSRHAAPLAGDLSEFADGDAAARAVTVRQLEHLKSYPLVREQVEKGALQLHAWFYDIGEVDLFEYDEAKGEYAVLGGRQPVRDAAE